MINLKRLKKSLSPEQIIKIVESLGGSVYKQTEKEIIFSSICCKKKSENQKPKLYYYTNSKMLICWLCNFKGDIFELVKKRWTLERRTFTFVQVIEYVCDVLKIDSGIFNKPQVKVTYDWQTALGKYSRHYSTQNELVVYDDNILNFFPELYSQSWIDEGITIETMKKFRIKYYPLHDSIVIPVTDDGGNLIGIRERFLKKLDVEYGKYKPLMLKDKTQFTFPTNQAFYGIEQNIEAIKRKKLVWLVEGEKSVLKFDVWYGKENVSLAMYGTNLGRYRRNYLTFLGVNEVCIMLDSDFHNIEDERFDRFELKVMAIARQLKGFFNVSVCYNNQGYEGYKFAPCDFSKEQFEKMYEEREWI